MFEEVVTLSLYPMPEGEGGVVMHMALEGIRVLDWTAGQHGPVATKILGDLGADVIKLEGPEGEMGRNWAVSRQHLHINRNIYFEVNNRNKRGIVLDLKNEEARQILYRLVEKSDVFVQNWRTGVAGTLGVDYQTLSKYNPKLIYASGNTFGPEGPESNRPGLDSMAIARSGFMLSIGLPDSPPLYPPGGLADQNGAIMLAEGILIALLARERFGIGQELHSSLLGSMVFLQSLSVMASLLLGPESDRPYERRDRKDARNALWNQYKCADGQWIQLTMARDAKYWHDFCRTMGIEELENDPRFATFEKRMENNRELISILDKVFATETRAVWLKRLAENRDFLFAAVNTIDDVVNDPQVLANKYIADFDHPEWGKIKEVAFPVKLTKTPASLRREAPMLGQHTEEVLMEILGYTWEDIGKLKERGVI